MSRRKNIQYNLFFGFLFLAFTLFYPLLISIYVFFPLFIGAIGYLFIYGIEKRKPLYSLFAFIYMINLEINLALPLFLIIISTLIFYRLFYFPINKLKICRACKSVLYILFLDFIYVGVLYCFDFIFQTQSIILDKILLYSLLLDMLVLVVL